MDDILTKMELEYFGNTIAQYASSLVLLLVLLSFFAIFKLIILRKIKKITKGSEVGELVVKIIDRIRPAFYGFLSLYIALLILNIPKSASVILFAILVAWISIRAVISLQQVIDFFVEKQLDEEKKQEASLGIIVRVVKAMLWFFALLVFLSTMGVNITALVAGLGIGGIAVGFALQNILSDLFSSFAIFFDKPFVEGDFIIVGDKLGTVERIGIKTTRLRALQGEEIVISNRELTSAQIHNFKDLESRRRSFDFGVTYDTPSEKLEKIPGIVEKVIEEEELADFERAHFNQFGDSSLSFTVVYYVNSHDFKEYMDVHQSILFKVKREFEKEGISMAFPTRTVYINK